MIDLDKRLQADGRSWRAAVGMQSPVVLPPAYQPGTTLSRWWMPVAAAAALVAVTAGVLGLTHGPRVHHSGPLAALGPQIGCTIPGLAVEAAAPGTTGLHSSQQAEVVAGIPATVQATSHLSMVTDPTAPKLGIGPADAARLMWVFTARTTDAGSGPGRPPGHGPYIPAGTVFNGVWLVDDLTLTPAGSFACPAPDGSSAPKSP